MAFLEALDAMHHTIELLTSFAALACVVHILPRQCASSGTVEPNPAEVNGAAHNAAGTVIEPESRLVSGLDVNFRLAKREGPPPEVSPSPPGTNIAHSQLTQQAPLLLQEALFVAAAGLPNVEVAPSGISVPGARAFLLDKAVARGPSEAFQIGTEFAHIHPAYDGSLHMKLPPVVAAVVYRQGFGEPHPRSGTPLVYGPRTQEEVESIWQILLRSYEWARSGRTVPL
jgi:phospholipase/carboxylesterase